MSTDRLNSKQLDWLASLIDTYDQGTEGFWGKGQRAMADALERRGFIVINDPRDVGDEVGHGSQPEAGITVKGIEYLRSRRSELGAVPAARLVRFDAEHSKDLPTVKSSSQVKPTAPRKLLSRLLAAVEGKYWRSRVSAEFPLADHSRVEAALVEAEAVGDSGKSTSIGDEAAETVAADLLNGFYRRQSSPAQAEVKHRTLETRAKEVVSSLPSLHRWHRDGINMKAAVKEIAQEVREVESEPFVGLQLAAYSMFELLYELTTKKTGR